MPIQTNGEIAGEVLELMGKLKAYHEDHNETKFRDAVRRLCNQIKSEDAKSNGGQFIPDPLV
jgi:hypothetical protein